MTAKLEVRSFTRSRDNRGCRENFPESLSTPTATIPEFFGAFVPIDPMNVRTKLEVRSFTRS